MENMVVIEEMLTDVSHEAAPQLKPEIGRIAGRETYSLAEADASMPKASVRADSAESVGQFKNILENAPIGVAITDSDGRFMHVNRAMCELVGYSEQALLKSTFQGITYPEDVYADLARSRQMLAGTISTYQREKRCVRADGDIVWVLVSASITAGPQGKPPYIISHVQDLSEHKRLEMQLHDLALSDRLTGLANRTLFENRLALALIWARRRARKIAVLFLDLERFKLINDSFGHDAGDNLLIAVADVMMQDAESTIEVLEAVKALGVEVAIDTFGTGYSSLSYLKRFPVDILKIDQSFVRELGKDEAASFLVEGVINLALPLSLVTIAEGVETPEQLLELQALGCDLAQGFHFARPQPAAHGGTA
jgi:PAS domain S-box-containing protein